MSKIMSNYKIMLVGMAGVGKTQYIRRCMGNKFEEKYIPTLSHYIYIVRCTTDIGNIIEFEVWDLAGQEMYDNNRREFYENSVGCIVMIDETKISHKIIHKISHGEYNKLPTIFVANKSDIKKNIGSGIDVFMSVKHNINIELPLLFLARKISNNPDLNFV